MPALDATTTAAFAAAGIAPSTLYAFLVDIWATSLAFLIWSFKAFLPFWLVLGFIGVMIGFAFALMKFRKH